MHQGSQQGMNPMGPMGMNPMGPRMPPVSSSGSMMPSQMMRPNGPSINSSESKTNLKIYIFCNISKTVLGQLHSYIPSQEFRIFLAKDFLNK